MKDSIKLSILLPISPKEIYTAWLNSKEHTAFTGAKAKINPKVGGTFTAWDEYISGKTMELMPYKKIVQNWRTTEFPEKSPDSLLEINFKELKNGTKLTLLHSKIPKGQVNEYKQGWIDYYFEPMKKYYSTIKNKV